MLVKTTVDHLYSDIIIYNKSMCKQQPNQLSSYIALTRHLSACFHLLTDVKNVSAAADSSGPKI